MSSVELYVPDLGVEGKVEVVEVLVSPGDTIAQDDPICVLESDKATMEIPAEQAGDVQSVNVSVGDQVAEGDLLVSLLPGQPSKADEVVTEASAKAKSPTPKSQPSEPENQKNLGANESDVFVPDLGGAEAVEVIEVAVSEGDEIAQDQALIVLESDKATMEIPAPEAGTCLSVAVKVGDKVSEGDVIGTLLTQEKRQEPSQNMKKQTTENSERSAAPSSSIPSTPAPRATSASQNAEQKSETAKVHAGPAVRKLAREMGVDLAQVKATGRGGRVLKEDLKGFVKQAMTQGVASSTPGLPATKLPDFSQFGEIEVVQMEKLHRVTALNMQQSWSTVPHVTQFEQADITELEAFRKAKKEEALNKGVKLTPLPFLLKACGYALEKLPQFNVSLDMANQQLIRKRYIHIGVAVDTPKGLVVPVVRDVNRKSVWQLAEEVQQLAEKARDRKLTPSDMQGACFTISSLGSIGGTAFTPIVNTPEVAILGVSKASHAPVYNGSGFDARLMLPLSLSYDHRAVNGADAAKFTSLLATVLADLRELLL